MIKYYAYLAWLHAVPEVRAGKRSSKSRLAQYMAIKGAAPTMPKVHYGAHLIEWLQDARVINRDGSPLTFSEMQAWSMLTGRRLTWWEAETLAKMSEAYAMWSVKASKADCKSPIDGTPELSAADQIKESFKSIDTKKLKRGARRG